MNTPGSPPPQTGESWLSGSEYTMESITNMNNSSTIWKNSKSFLCMSECELYAIKLNTVQFTNYNNTY